MAKYIGCSWYYYPARIGKFYPKHLPRSEWLRFYAEHFNTIELNNTFYRIPTLKALQKRASDTPADFAFILKVPKIITHEKRLQWTEELLKEFVEIAKQWLNDKLKAVLFQLPPSLHYSDEMLAGLLSLQRYAWVDYAFEFRHKSRRRENVFESLHSSGDIFCSVSYPGLPDQLTGRSKQYIRMHGVPILYKSAYGQAWVQPIADHIILTKPETLYVLFNNTRFGASLDDIPVLKDMLNS